jgi:hypothetical protein
MALAFVTGVLALFALVLVWERPSDPDQRLRPAGLLRWMMAGNWTAKPGALLLSIGSGALLRYLMLNVTYPPVFKIMAGVAIAAALGIAAALLAARPQRRAISLALSGASLAVCYLTAYSAFGFFHFVADLQGLGLLFIVASLATAVAILRRAVSIAVLAMAGAYIAPAFALHTSDPASVYGYYVAASLVTSLMVWLRGWQGCRALWLCGDRGRSDGFRRDAAANDRTTRDAHHSGAEQNARTGSRVAAVGSNWRSAHLALDAQPITHALVGGRGVDAGCGPEAHPPRLRFAGSDRQHPGHDVRRWGVPAGRVARTPSTAD